MPESSSNPATVKVAEDKMRAWILPAPGIALANADPQTLRIALASANISIDKSVEQRMETFARLVAESGWPEQPFLIAAGTEPTDGQPGTFEWTLPNAFGETEPQNEDEEDHIDYRSMNFIRTVESGTVIGKLIPPTPAISGIDVYGVERKAKQGNPVELGPNVQLDEDGETVTALIPGRVVYAGLRLNIVDVLQVRNVDFETGNIDATNDVEIRGTVGDLFKVVTKKSITVWEAIEAAEVSAGENLFVRGGILGRHKGRVRAGGNLAAKFISETDVRVVGDIRVAREVLNSTLRSQGQIIAERGAIIGGRTYAQKGVTINTLGSDRGVVTPVRVGPSMANLCRILALGEQIEKSKETVEKIRQMVNPLIADQKRLRPEQKERATELLFKADEMEMRINEAKEEQADLRGENQNSGSSAVLVNGRICAGVTIAIGDREVRFDNEMKGPVKIERRKMETGVTEFVSVNQLSGSIKTLMSRKIELIEDSEDQTEPQTDAETAETQEAST